MARKSVLHLCPVQEVLLAQLIKGAVRIEDHVANMHRELPPSTRVLTSGERVQQHLGEQLSASNCLRISLSVSDSVGAWVFFPFILFAFILFGRFTTRLQHANVVEGHAKLPHNRDVAATSGAGTKERGRW